METPLDPEILLNMSTNIEKLKPEDAEWVTMLFEECMRARLVEAELLTKCHETMPEHSTCLDENLAQVALDTAEWLKTLWDVGYMGANNFPSPPRSAFPLVEVEDVLKSALFARIRLGKRPLPFPPPTRKGKPWHELIDSNETIHNVEIEIIEDSHDIIAINIEDCHDWNIVEEKQKRAEYIMQHKGKGPLFKLLISNVKTQLIKEPPRLRYQIVLQDRAGFKTYILKWQNPNKTNNDVVLRASTWERADAEANYWIASKYPELYGQVAFEHVETF